MTAIKKWTLLQTDDAIAISVALLIGGGGRWSVDRFIGKNLLKGDS